MPALPVSRPPVDLSGAEVVLVVACPDRSGRVTERAVLQALCASASNCGTPSLIWVERHFSYGIARAYAGHTDSTGPATTSYIKADLYAVATALAAMTGQPHPLADHTTS